MDYLAFSRQMAPYGVFGMRQITLRWPQFNRCNLTHWVKRGLLVKLRNGCYALPASKGGLAAVYSAANRIYRPSYVSLHTALAHYGLIPEGVVAVTSVTALKTATFDNALGTFVYRSVKPSMMFGYRPEPGIGNGSVWMATPEKALVDLLYLYPQYKTDEDMLQLRLDDYYMATQLNRPLLEQYLLRAGNAALTRRVTTLLNVYHD